MDLAEARGWIMEAIVILEESKHTGFKRAEYEALLDALKQADEALTP